MASFFVKRVKTEAKVVRRNQTPCLLASFGAANPPLIWQLDLEKMSSHTISLREKEGEWDLGMVLPGGVFTSVAHFDERPLAEEAYQTVSRVLVHDAARNGRWGWGRRFFAFIIFVFLAFFVADILFTRNPAPISVGGEGMSYRSGAPAPQSENTVSPPQRQEIQTGVPMNADNVLETPASQ